MKFRLRGNAAIFLTLISFALMAAGALVGTRLVQQGSRIPSQACETQCAICGNNDHGQTVCAGGYYESCGIVTLCNGTSKWCWSRGDRCSGGPAPTNPPPRPPDNTGCPPGEDWGPCQGVCANAQVQQMFINTWCDGPGRWRWERAGNNTSCGGNPSIEKSKGPCPGASYPPGPYRSPTPVKTECEMGGGYCEVRNICQADGVAYVGGLGCTGANVVCCGYTQPSAGPVQCGTNGSYCEIIDTCPANTYVDTSALGCPSRTQCCRPRIPPSSPPSGQNPQPPNPPPASDPRPACERIPGNWCVPDEASCVGYNQYMGCPNNGVCCGSNPSRAISSKCLDTQGNKCVNDVAKECVLSGLGTTTNDWCPGTQTCCKPVTNLDARIPNTVSNSITQVLSAWQNFVENYNGALEFPKELVSECYTPGLQKRTFNPQEYIGKSWYTPPCAIREVI